VLTGLAYRLPLRRAVFYEPLLAIDPHFGWARLLGEWVVLGRKVPAIALDPADALRRAAAWIARELGDAAGAGP
jgi:hypothetical protein